MVKYPKLGIYLKNLSLSSPKKLIYMKNVIDFGFFWTLYMKYWFHFMQPILCD